MTRNKTEMTRNSQYYKMLKWRNITIHGVNMLLQDIKSYYQTKSHWEIYKITAERYEVTFMWNKVQLYDIA